jgi:hypothetical protein
MDSGDNRATVLRGIEWNGAPALRQAVASMGRTEDVCFSPGNRRLAVVGFSGHRLHLFDIDIRRAPDGVAVSLTGAVALSSDTLNYPHGVDFVDEDTVIVTNRGGDVSVFKLPPPASTVSEERVEPLATWPAGGDSLLRSPGSVCAIALATGDIEVLICNNTAHTVTRHRLDPSSYLLRSSEVLVRKWLDIPDGITRSADRRWFAVSNHNTHQVFLYDESRAVTADMDPNGILRGVQYPHALRFGADGRRVLVADAGAPFIHVYRSDDSDWSGVWYPTASVRIMDDETFTRGRHNPQEGGPKGLAIDRRSQVAVVTSECQPLEFFALDRLNDAVAEQQTCERRRLDVHSELELLEKHHHDANAATVAELTSAVAELNALISYMQGSRSWQLTAPLRKIDSLLRRH